jgi:putative ABC transport system substrate-binding protein
MNNRRKLLVALGAGALSAPVAILAQQQASKATRIGYLQAYPSLNDPYFEVFKQQLRELGRTEGKAMAIDYLSAEGNYDRLPALATELVRRNVDVIVTDGGTPSVIAARNATQTIPIVFVAVANPVALGIVASLARPGGNVTGTSGQQDVWAPKMLELFKETLPSARRIAILSNPGNSSLPPVLRAMDAAAKTTRLEIRVVNARAPDEFEPAFSEIARDQPAGLIILVDTLFTSEAGRLASLAARHRLATLGGHFALPESGGLMSYGANRLDLVRRGAVLVDKILKGARPGELPVELPLRYDLTVNLKTARALGITIPQSVLVRADRVIE